MNSRGEADTSPSPRKSLRFWLGYLIFIALLLESFARLAFHSSSPLLQADDPWWRLQWVSRRPHGDSAPLAYTFDVYDPLRGWALKPLVRDWPVLDGKSLNTNSRGIRGKREYSYEKTPGRLRILVLGDSFTFGEDVGDEETYPASLQRLLPRAEIINFGVHGYGHDQMLIYLENEGVKYKPDVVVLGFVSDDMARSMLAFRDYAKPRFELEKGGRLKLTHVPVPTPREVLAGEPFKPRILDLASTIGVGLSRRWGSYYTTEALLTAAIFDEMVAAARGIGATPVFVYLDDVHTMSLPVADPRLYEFFLDYCEDRKVDGLSVRTELVLGGKAGVVLGVGGHFSADENKLVAQALAKHLARR